jgi:rhodanese-related sulfurtransferase
VSEKGSKPLSKTSSARMTRRAFGLGAVVVVVGGAVFASRWYNISAKAGATGTLSTPDAHSAALPGEVVLIDIRRPDEWQRTGVPIALICARGVRSRGMTARLTAAGFTNIIDVPEGMLGSGAGSGWLMRGLPTVAWISE